MQQNEFWILIAVYAGLGLLPFLIATLRDRSSKWFVLITTVLAFAMASKAIWICALIWSLWPSLFSRKTKDGKQMHPLFLGTLTVGATLIATKFLPAKWKSKLFGI